MVQTIVNTVKDQGDQALLHYSQTYEKWAPIDPAGFRVSPEEFERANALVPDALKDLIDQAIDHIRAYHRHQIPRDFSYSPSPGIQMGQIIRPIERAMLYIPGGKAAYPSTVLMNAIPALLAGVPSLCLMTPPDQKGDLPPLVLVAAQKVGVTEIYKLGGAQAIAAAAYGTKTIPAVKKIVGPGNQYVATAKQLVFGQVAIDLIAGPSEVLIIADETANPDWIAADLLAQAEHDEAARLILITTDTSMGDRVQRSLQVQLDQLPRKAIASVSMGENYEIFVVNTLEEAVLLSNRIAPEHLELQVADPESLLPYITSAGSIFMGSYTPEALGDYWAGPNHTLPTGGTAAFSSPLGVYDFIKRPSYLKYDQVALAPVISAVGALAEAEGLWGHAKALYIRKEVPND